MLRVGVDVFCDNEMIEESDFHEPQGIDQATGNHVIRGTCLGNSTRMLGGFSECHRY